jgi:hypothetical protein
LSLSVEILLRTVYVVHRALKGKSRKGIRRRHLGFQMEEEHLKYDLLTSYDEGSFPAGVLHD